jgi:DNA-binding response OmpR family regulator
MGKIVVVEDNASYAEDVSEYLVRTGYAVRTVPNAAGLWQSLAADSADVVLLDLGLPDEDGFAVIPKLRQLHPDCGLIVLTARVSFDSRIQGLRLGADAYLTKPIKFPELAAHIEAVCRRVRPKERQEPPPSWKLTTLGYQIAFQGREAIALTEKEFNFLHILAQNRLAVPRESLLLGIGDSNDPQAIKRMDMLVYRLRKKIKAAWDIELPLRSSYGGGFSLSEAFDLA